MPDPIAPERLARLRQLHETATPGPWEHGIGPYGRDVEAGGELIAEVIEESKPLARADADLIVEARNALPDLLDEIDRLRSAKHDPALDAARQLVVTTDGPGVLIVDGEPLICCAQCVRVWRLVETSTGRWRHPESGVEDRLLLVLRSIAQHYLDHRCPHRQEARRG